jgi:hypothetical protein
VCLRRTTGSFLLANPRVPSGGRCRFLGSSYLDVNASQTCTENHAGVPVLVWVPLVSLLIVCKKSSCSGSACSAAAYDLCQASANSSLGPMGVFVTREHVRHNKSGIAHRGRTRINHLRELPTKLDHFAAVGRLPCPAEPVNHRCTFGMRGAEKLGRQLVVPKSRAAFFNLEKQVIPRAALGAQNGGLSYETVC